MADKIEIVRNAIKEYPDFPKKGIMFQDIFGVLSDPEANKALNELALDHVQRHSQKIDKIAALDSRGFLLGNAMALAVGKPFVPIRKAGKLPGECRRVSYSLEYGEDCLEIQSASLKEGDKVLIVDDLMATGGTMSAAASLVTECGARVEHCWVVIELRDLQGREKLQKKGHKLEALIVMEGVE